MKKTQLLLLIATLFSLCVLPANAQDKTTSNKQVYVELGGYGLGLSANFDSRFKAGEKLGWGYRLGIGFASVDIADDDYGWGLTTKTVYTLPLGINYILGKNSSPHTFEIGAGATLFSHEIFIYDDYYDPSVDGSHITGNLSFMYRRQPLNGGFTWRAGFTPVIETSGDMSIGVCFGIGYSF